MQPSQNTQLMIQLISLNKAGFLGKEAIERFPFKICILRYSITTTRTRMRMRITINEITEDLRKLTGIQSLEAKVVK